MLGAAAAALAFSSAAMAQTAPAPAADAPAAAPAPAWSLAYNVAFTSDYLFRGLSQTSGDAAPSGGIDFTAGQFYLGTWESKVNFGATGNDPQNKTAMEYDLYGGFRPMLGPVALDIGIIRYGYMSAPAAAKYDYYEGKILATYAAGPNTIGGSFYYSPAFFGDTGTAEYYEINDAYAATKALTFSGAYGYQALEKKKAGIDGYSTWNVGGTYAFNSHVGLDVRYWGTDSKATNFYTKTFAGDRFVGTVKVTF